MQIGPAGAFSAGGLIRPLAEAWGHATVSKGHLNKSGNKRCNV